MDVTVMKREVFTILEFDILFKKVLGWAQDKIFTFMPGGSTETRSDFSAARRCKSSGFCRTNTALTIPVARENLFEMKERVLLNVFVFWKLFGSIKIFCFNCHIQKFLVR